MAPRPVGNAECGPASLYALTQYLEIPVSRERVFAEFKGQTRLTTFFSLSIAAKKLGLHAEGVRTNITALQQSQVCGILHIDAHHFIALVDHVPSGVILENPIAPRRTRREIWSYSQLAARWDGTMIIVSVPPLKSNRQPQQIRSGWRQEQALSHSGFSR